MYLFNIQHVNCKRKKLNTFKMLYIKRIIDIDSSLVLSAQLDLSNSPLLQPLSPSKLHLSLPLNLIGDL